MMFSPCLVGLALGVCRWHHRCTLLPLLIVVPLAPVCLRDNVSIDKHLVTDNTGIPEVFMALEDVWYFQILPSVETFFELHFDIHMAVKSSLEGLDILIMPLPHPPIFITSLFLSSGAANVSLLLICLLASSYY